MKIKKKGDIRVDIVIPVYNALEDLKLCMLSLKKHTDLTKHRIILINDCSSDTNILPYLKTCVQENIILLNNENNLGFSATINRGLEYSDRDVLLLNTDTIVTKNWIEKIILCAYSEKNIGTVTPFSNNATLCSVPNFCQENIVPEGYTIDEYSAIIERCSLKKYPQITVAVGFCMYIKRDVINDIGYFDAETFGKGYGEENDFCNRAEQVGYKHVLCDDTYIFHSGTASFISNEKKKLMQEHEEILNNRYPSQMRTNHLYCMRNPDQYLRDNIDLHTKFRGKKNILYVIHMDFETTVGGTQYHVKDLMNSLRIHNNIFVVSPYDKYLKLTIYLESETIDLKYYLQSNAEYLRFFDKQQEIIFENIYTAFKIDIVHIHHLLNYSFDCIYSAYKLGIPVIFTTHDYYMICPTISLINGDNKYCGNNTNDVMCKKCLKNKMGYSEAVSIDFLNKWRRESEKALQLCKKIIAPSFSVKEIFSEFYESIKDKIIVIEHGIQIQKIEIDENKIKKSEKLKCYLEQYPQGNDNSFLGWAYYEGVDSEETELYIMLEDSNNHKRLYACNKFERSDLAEVSMKYFHSGFQIKNLQTDLLGKLKISLLLKFKDDYFVHTFPQTTIFHSEIKNQNTPLKIAFIGGLSKIKGVDEIYKIIKQNKDDSIQWYILGPIGESDLVSYEQKNLIKLGSYDRKNIIAILKEHQIDITCILSICPETYCYTLSESILAGIPVVVTDIGALGERVRRDDLGWIVPTDALQKEYLKLLNYLKNNKEQIEEKKDRLKKFVLPTIDEMVDSYKLLYDTFDKLGCDYKFDSSKTFDAFVNANKVDFTPENITELRKQLESLENELGEIKGTSSYKIALKVSQMNIPYKAKIKRVLYWVYNRFFR